MKHPDFGQISVVLSQFIVGVLPFSTPETRFVQKYDQYINFPQKPKRDASVHIKI